MQITETSLLEKAEGPAIEGDFTFFKPAGPFSNIDVNKVFL